MASDPDPDDLEALDSAQDHSKYAHRKLVDNAFRYEEGELEEDQDDEPELDMSSFLQKQRLQLLNPSQEAKVDVDDVDHTIPTQTTSNDRKGKTVQIDWTDELDEMVREAKAADATRELKDRFRALPQKQGPSTTRERRKQERETRLGPLPLESGQSDQTKEQMQDFLDDLLG